jgi:hypothetical protein
MPGCNAALYRFTDAKGFQLAISTADGELVAPTSATIEGEKKGKALFPLVRGLQKRMKGG